MLKKICEHYAGLEIRQTGVTRQSGSSTHTVQSLFSLRISYYWNKKKPTHPNPTRKGMLMKLNHDTCWYVYLNLTCTWCTMYLLVQKYGVLTGRRL